MNNQMTVLKKVLRRIRRYWGSLILSLLLALPVQAASA